MPPVSKKRKANKKKKKKQKKETNPNPNYDPAPTTTTLLPLHHQENSQENHASTEEEGEEEMFVTPKSQPDAVAAADLQVRNGSVLKVGESDWILVDEGLKEKTRVGSPNETLPVSEGGKDEAGSVNTEENVEVEEESAQYYEVRGESPEVPVDSSASSEKEVKIAPWPDEESPSKDGDVDFKSVQAKLTLVDEESIVGITENHKELVKVDTTGNEGEVKEPSHVEGLKERQLDKLAEKYTLTEHPTPVTEGVTKHSEAKSENLDNIFVGIIDTSPCEKEVKVLDPQEEAGELSEIATRSEVARGPLVVCRATLWNCCGLLDVLTGS